MLKSPTFVQHLCQKKKPTFLEGLRSHICTIMCVQERYYNRETFSALFFVLQGMFFKPPSILCNSKN